MYQLFPEHRYLQELLNDIYYILQFPVNWYIIVIEQKSKQGGIMKKIIVAVILVGIVKVYAGPTGDYLGLTHYSKWTYVGWKLDSSFHFPSWVVTRDTIKADTLSITKRFSYIGFDAYERNEVTNYGGDSSSNAVDTVFEVDSILKIINDEMKIITGASIPANRYIVPFAIPSRWDKLSVGNGAGSMESVLVGAGRGDNVDRVYAGDASGYIYEYTYSGGSWTKAYVDSIGSNVSGLVIGAGRGDNVDRVYAGDASGYIYEYTYSGGSWTKAYVDSITSNVSDLVIGAGRGDNVDRVYAGDASGYIYEYTYSGGSWTKAYVDSITSNVSDLVIGAGRGDNVDRVYAGDASGYIYEYTYSGGSWTKAYVDSITSNVSDLVIGAGRGDNVDRVYAGTGDGHIYEYTYSGGSWIKSDVSNTAIVSMDIGAGRNDGVSRLYTASTDGHIYEFTYSGGNWIKADVGSSGSSMNDVVIGAGRGDNIKRVYGASSDHNVYEFTYFNGRLRTWTSGVAGVYYPDVDNDGTPDTSIVNQDTAVVLGEENITVPYGTFHTYKILIPVHANIRMSSGVTMDYYIVETQWYDTAFGYVKDSIYFVEYAEGIPTENTRTVKVLSSITGLSERSGPYLSRLSTVNTYFTSSPVLTAFKDYEIYNVCGTRLKHNVLPQRGIYFAIKKGRNTDKVRIIYR